MVGVTSVVCQIIDRLYNLSNRSRQTHSTSLTTRRSLQNGEYAKECISLYTELERNLVKKTNIDDLPGVMKGVDRKLKGGLANCLLSSFSQTLDVCFSLIEDENEDQSSTQVITSPPPPIVLGPADCPSDILPRSQSHQLLSSSLDCLDFIPKRKIPSYFNHVLTDESIIQKLIDVVVSPAFDVLLRQRVADLLSLGKMSRIVEKTLSDMDLRASILSLARDFLSIAEYPIQEQVIFFLHILHRRLNKTKVGAAYAREIRNSFRSTCPPLFQTFPNLSTGSKPFYDNIRDCLQQHQEDKMRAWERSHSYNRWWGEGEFCSTMHQVNGIYMEDKVRRLEVPIGYVSHIDVNASSISFWCFESEQNTQSPTSSPHLIVICHLDICRISYSKTYQTCRLFFKGPAFVKSGLASMLEVSSAQLNVSPATTINNISTNAAVSDDEEGSYNILVALKEGEFPNLQNSMRGQLHIMKLKASSHSPVKPPKPSHGAPPGHAHLSTRSIHEKYASNVAGVASPPPPEVELDADVDNHEPSHTPCVTPFHLKKKKNKTHISSSTSSVANSDTARSLYLAASNGIPKQKTGGTTASMASTVHAGQTSTKKRVLPAFFYETSGAKNPSKKEGSAAPLKKSDDATKMQWVHVEGAEGGSERSSENLEECKVAQEEEEEESEILIPSEAAMPPPSKQPQPIGTVQEASASFAALRECAEELGAKATGKTKLSNIVLNTDSDIEQLTSKLKDISVSYDEHRLTMEGNIVRSSLLNNPSQSQASFDP
ncbi:hypothetical protein TrRE_jg11000 [Triparma retinervis]|uniref:Uncharacterized protein n=1 Tax=Triparma retinervis TaxID=2557542 RepID=A0A9W7A4X0_9STRA|nr:hypothetical protein TrRE_jg11000 [Triparma retinervis]